jgi:hypothetical protein
LKTYYFTPEDLELINYIKLNNPIRIWLEPIYFNFEYESFHIRMGIRLAESFVFGINAYTQHIMGSYFERVNSIFVPQQLSKIMYENEPISAIYIARTQISYEDDPENMRYVTEILENPEINLSRNGTCFIVDTGLKIITESASVNCYIYNNEEDFLNYYNEYTKVPDEFLDNQDKYYSFVEV